MFGRNVWRPTSLTSTSLKESTASTFAWRTQRDRTTAGEDAYKVVLVITVTDGRDINAISVHGGEDEVALLPGAELTVDKIEGDASSLRIFLTQTK
jgi:hypothetical protein